MSRSDRATKARSRQLSWLLRHGAVESELAMDAAGWVDVADVLARLDIDDDQLREVVATNDKGRLQLEGSRIRACQGHSFSGTPVTRDALEASWSRIRPTDPLWHGTRVEVLAPIAVEGISPGERTHVHLAPRPDSRVGKRATVEVLLEIAPERLAAADVAVFRAPNGVVLVRWVPPSTIVGARVAAGDEAVAAAELRRTLGLTAR